jgi:uncharacterized protein (DUF58 family)
MSGPVPSRRDALFDASFLDRLEGLRLLSKRHGEHRGASDAQSKSMGDGLEFADHRSYQRGDDVRFVDWAYYARMEQLLVRLFHEHSQPHIGILIDRSASMTAGGSERFDHALRIAAALAFVAMGSGATVQLVGFAQTLDAPFVAGRDPQQILSILDFLAGLSAGETTDLATCCASFNHQFTRCDTVLVISDFLDAQPSLQAALLPLHDRHRHVVGIHVFAPRDADPTLRGTAELSHAETQQRTTIHVTESVRDAYRAAWVAFVAELDCALTGAGGTVIPAACDESFEQLILHAMQHRVVC